MMDVAMCQVIDEKYFVGYEYALGYTMNDIC
jgi:hypothetical protein